MAFRNIQHPYTKALISAILVIDLSQQKRERTILQGDIPTTLEEYKECRFRLLFFANGIRDYDCLVTTWGADYPDPSANLDPLLNIANIDIGGYNCAAYSNAEVDGLLTKTVTTTDESKRMDLLFQACDIIIADEPYYVYNHTNSFAAFNKGWTLGDMSYPCAWDWNFKDIVYNG